MTWIRAQRTAGKSYSALAIEVGQPPVVLEATNSTLEALLTAGTRLRRLIARALYADGMTMDEIATALGVSRQRVSHLLSSDPDCIAPPWTRR